MKKKKLIVLIVDDNKFFVDRMISLLEETENIGYINVAFDYEEGLTCFEKERPDLILLDINLPGKNGIELLRTIHDSGQPCSVIMISNHDNEYYRQQCKQLGAEHFLDKSSDFGMVPSIIGQMGNA
ncbi:MAG TPA: response regulator [Chitinophagaceae bacterium]|nr:response regulator [Chitinophagaceae bacterium]